MSDPDPSTSDGPELLPARMLNEFVYCPRLFHLEWVQKQWTESVDTLAGAHEHRRVDKEKGDLPPPAELVGKDGEARSVLLSAPVTGIVAKLDLIELRDGSVVPVDYKHGRAPDGSSPVWDTDRVQIGAQALVLIENGYRCEQGIVYYVASRRRVPIRIDEELLREVREVAQRARACSREPNPPPPLKDSPKCPRCSLVVICLPDETNLLIDSAQPREVRRLYPAADDALPLYVQSPGARIGKKGDELEITQPDKEAERVRLLDVSQVSVLGNVQVTAGAFAELLRRGIPICHFSFGGWFLGITHGVGQENCYLKLHQYRASLDEGLCLELARGFVSRKIKNCRTLLRRNASGVEPEVLPVLERMSTDAERAESLEALLGVEGSAARVYFAAFPRMLKHDESEAMDFDFSGRNRRPPRDPVNALLSLAYSILVRDWTIQLLSVNLDPFLGFYHQPRHGRPSLALDLMEEFRPLIADSVVIQLINNGEIHAADFIRRGPGVALTGAGRRAFFLAYERRMAHLVQHPLFGYRVSYRRLLEVQARLLGRYLSGELSSYDGFRTR